MNGQLDAERIRAPISGVHRKQLDLLEVFAEIESTNSYLMKQAAPAPGRFRVALAEHQTAGRGRMDRQWHSPESTGVCLSMSYTFASTPEMLACATLAIGVGVARALEELGVRGIGLKWPNDLVLENGKLGGILTEVQSGSGSAVTLVTGVGVNFDLNNNAAVDPISTRLGRVSDLASFVQHLPSRSAVSTALIEGIFNALAEFDSQGFASAAAAWEKYDWLRGQDISVEQANGLASGVCKGIDSDGALILRTSAGMQRISSGSVRFAGESRGNT